MYDKCTCCALESIQLLPFSCIPWILHTECFVSAVHYRGIFKVYSIIKK